MDKRPPTPPPPPPISPTTPKVRGYKKQASWPSKATHILGFMHHDTKEKLQVETDDGEKEVYTREELTISHRHAANEFKEIQSKKKEIQSILQALSDSASEATPPFMCCCANAELQLIIEECLDAYSRRVENFKGESALDTDEKTQLMSTLGRLREHARRYSMAEHSLNESKKKYTEMSLEVMHKELCSLQDEVAAVKVQFNVERKKMEKLRDHFHHCQKKCYFIRPFKYFEIIEEATVDCLTD